MPTAAERAPGVAAGRSHRLAYATRDGTVRVVDVDTGAVVDRDAPARLLERTRRNRVAGRPLDGRRLAGRGSARLHAARPAEADPGGLGRVRPVPLTLVSYDRGVVLRALIAAE